MYILALVTCISRWHAKNFSVFAVQIPVIGLSEKFTLQKFCGRYKCTRSRDSVVGIATGYGLDDRVVGVRVPVGSRIFSSPRRPDQLWGSTQSPIQLGTGGSFLGGKAVGE
jgi:hypothetical protein